MREFYRQPSRSGRLEVNQLPKLFEVLSQSGYTVIAPTLRENVIVFDRLSRIEQLPCGYTDVHDGGSYRLNLSDNNHFFDYVVGPQSVKRYLYPPRQLLLRARNEIGEIAIEPCDTEHPSYAFFGVRPCDLAAVSVQDRIYLDGPYPDPGYQARRTAALFIVVNCAHPGGTCFCASMNTGPRAESGFDLSLTEIDGPVGRFFIVHSGSLPGEEIYNQLDLVDAASADLQRESELLDAASHRMGRTLDTSHIKELLQRNEEHPRWNQVAERCLNCCNCTMVCPTCFCVTVEDSGDVTGKIAERTRRWDSCFTIDFSYIHGGPVRTSPMARYRHWMTHKLANWHDQFGVSGCVGCGRCITWCPVGIDITEEAAAIRAATTTNNI